MIDLDNARRRGAPPPPPTPLTPEHASDAPLETEQDDSRSARSVDGSTAPVDWCIETINESGGGIAVEARSQPQLHLSTSPRSTDLHGTLAHGTHSTPRRVAIVGNVLLTVRCNEGGSVKRVNIACALYKACAAWAVDNVHIAVAGGAVVITVHPFTQLGSTAALDMVKCSTWDVLRRHRDFEYKTRPSQSVVVDVQGAASAAADAAGHVVVDVKKSSSAEDVPAPAAVVRRRSPLSAHSQDITGYYTENEHQRADVIDGITKPGARDARRRRQRNKSSDASDGMHVAQRYAYMLLFMLGTVSVAVLSVYIVFFGSLDFTLQTGIAFTRV